MRAAAAGDAEVQSENMPGACAPWPGARIMVDMRGVEMPDVGRVDEASARERDRRAADGRNVDDDAKAGVRDGMAGLEGVQMVWC
jgi:hypothetical protein